MGDPVAPIEIPAGLNLYHYTNRNLSAFLGAVSRLQVLLDEWNSLSPELQSRVRDEIRTMSGDLTLFIAQVREYVEGL